MPRIWSMKHNSHSNWDFSQIAVENGVLNLEYWTEQVLTYDWIISHKIPKIDNFDQNSQNGNTVSTINTISKAIGYKEGQHINTVSVYSHPDYNIYAMYIDDYDFGNSDNMNYCATLINTEKMQIYETVAFFKVQNELTVDLKISEILALLANFYFLQTVKLSNSKFEKICINNFEPEINRMFGTYYKKLFGKWIIMSEDEKMLEKVKNENNNIDELNGLVWFKIKEYTGDVSLFHSKLENNKTGDCRGVYENVDEQYVRKRFF